jgi:hypothetical protein
MALTDYSSMENEIKNAPEPTAIKKGTEVRARIIGVRTGEVEKEGSDYYGFSYFSVSFDAPDEPLAREFSDFFWGLENKDKMSEKDYLNASVNSALSLKRSALITLAPLISKMI